MPQRPKTPSRSASEPECKAACTHCGQHLEGTSASCPACADVARKPPWSPEPTNRPQRSLNWHENGLAMQGLANVILSLQPEGDLDFLASGSAKWWPPPNKSQDFETPKSFLKCPECRTAGCWSCAFRAATTVYVNGYKARHAALSFKEGVPYPHARRWLPAPVPRFDP